MKLTSEVYNIRAKIGAEHYVKCKYVSRSYVSLLSESQKTFSLIVH
jgi:hypothetical protein